MMSFPDRYVMDETITLGGGCFWCLEALYSQLNGIIKVEPGYAGGSLPYPTYEQVGTGQTGHAEVVQLTYDPDTISLEDILRIFFIFHDPTTRNRQGMDIGPQYRSVILYRTPEQRDLAERIIQDFSEKGIWPDPIVTTLEPFTAFYPAEKEHIRYFNKNPEKNYCRLVIAPKIAKLRQFFQGMLKA